MRRKKQSTRAPTALSGPSAQGRGALAGGQDHDVDLGVSGLGRDAGRPHLVIFACFDALGCGDVAAAWFALLADPHKARAVVTNSQGFLRIPAEMVVAAKEAGVPLAAIHVRRLSDDLIAAADLVVTMDETFHRVLLGATTPRRREHWVVGAEVSGDGIDRARALHDLIRSRVAMLVFSEGWGRADISREAARVTLPRRRTEYIATL